MNDCADFKMPSNAERREDARIAVRGHRLSLHVVLREIARGVELNDLSEAFPTLTIEDLNTLIAFYHNQPDDAEKIVAAGVAAESSVNRSSGPTLNQLRQRRQERRDYCLTTSPR